MGRNFNVQGSIELELRVEVKNYRPGNGGHPGDPESEGEYFDIDNVTLLAPYKDMDGKTRYKEKELPESAWSFFEDDINELISHKGEEISEEYRG